MKNTRFHLLACLLLGTTCLSAQHHINAIFFDADNLQTLANSDMFEGCKDKNLFIFRKIPAGADGEIEFHANDFEDSDDFLLKLTDNTSTEEYALRLSAGRVTIEADVVKDMGTFSNTDKFKIVRCQLSILFFHNGKLIHFVQLNDNNFSMDGGINVVSASDTLAEIWFRTL